MPIEYRISICDVDGTENLTGNHYKISKVIPKPGSPYGWDKHTSYYRILRKGTWQWNVAHWLVTADTNDVTKLLEICFYG